MDDIKARLNSDREQIKGKITPNVSIASSLTSNDATITGSLTQNTESINGALTDSANIEASLTSNTESLESELSATENIEAELLMERITSVPTFLDDLGDVNIDNPQADESLVFNGTEWVNAKTPKSASTWDELENKPFEETGDNFEVKDGVLELAGTILSEIESISDKYVLPSGGIPQTDLSSEVSDKLESIADKYELPTDGIPQTDLSSEVSDKLESIESKYEKPTDGISESDLSTSVTDRLLTTAPSATDAGKYLKVNTTGGIEYADSEGGASSWDDLTDKPFDELGTDFKVSAKKLGLSYDIKYKINKTDTMTVALSEIPKDAKDRLFQYVGEDTDNYKFGHFYKAVVENEVIYFKYGDFYITTPNNSIHEWVDAEDVKVWRRLPIATQTIFNEVLAENILVSISYPNPVISIECDIYDEHYVLSRETETEDIIKGDLSWVEVELGGGNDIGLSIIDGKIQQTFEESDEDNSDNETATKALALDATLKELNTKIDTLIEIVREQQEIIDNLTSNSAVNPLSANQGRLLKETLDSINTKFSSSINSLNSRIGSYFYAKQIYGMNGNRYVKIHVNHTFGSYTRQVFFMYNCTGSTVRGSIIRISTENGNASIGHVAIGSEISGYSVVKNSDNTLTATLDFGGGSYDGVNVIGDCDFSLDYSK